MTAGSGAPDSSVSPAVAFAFALMTYVAVAIAGLGVTSLITDQDVISVPGLGVISGVLGFGLSCVVFAGGLWISLRRRTPSYADAVLVTVATVLAYIGGIWFGAVVSGADVAAATAAMGVFAMSWFNLVLALAALVAAGGGVALVRATGGIPRWPWENDSDSDE